MNGQIDRWKGGCMDGSTDREIGWMDGWTGRLKVEGWVDG